jgi:hypothetical protein
MLEHENPKTTAKLILETNLVYKRLQTQNLHLNNEGLLDQLALKFFREHLL